MSVIASPLASRLFTQMFVRAQIKENIKASRHCPLWGDSPMTGEFPAQRASHADNIFIWRRHHVMNIGMMTSWPGNAFRAIGSCEGNPLSGTMITELWSNLLRWVLDWCEISWSDSSKTPNNCLRPGYLYQHNKLVLLIIQSLNDRWSYGRDE